MTPASSEPRSALGKHQWRSEGGQWWHVAWVPGFRFLGVPNLPSNHFLSMTFAWQRGHELGMDVLSISAVSTLFGLSLVYLYNLARHLRFQGPRTSISMGALFLEEGRAQPFSTLTPPPPSATEPLYATDRYSVDSYVLVD